MIDVTTIIAVIVNFSNFTRDGIIRLAFQPYYAILGNFTWGIIFGFIGVALYANERSMGTVSIFLIIIGVFFSIAMAQLMWYLFGIILGLLLATIFYRTFVVQKL